MPKATPRRMAWSCPQRVRSEIFRLSSWATLAMMVRRNSPSLSRVSMPSLRKITPTPCSLSRRVTWRASTVLRAKRDTSLVRIRSTAPDRASRSSSANLGRRSGGARQALVGENARAAPAVPGDVPLKVGLLGSQGVKLILLVRGYPAVGGHPKAVTEGRGHGMPPCRETLWKAVDGWIPSVTLCSGRRIHHQQPIVAWETVPVFQPALSLWKATAAAVKRGDTSWNFNPRSPCGERR